MILSRSNVSAVVLQRGIPVSLLLLIFSCRERKGLQDKDHTIAVEEMCEEPLRHDTCR